MYGLESGLLWTAGALAVEFSKEAIDTWTRQQARPSIPIVTYARPIDERW
jgi:hypothetical protein